MFENSVMFVITPKKVPIDIQNSATPEVSGGLCCDSIKNSETETYTVDLISMK